MIEVEDLHFSYTKEDKALRGVSFSIKDREWVSIIGHNGSGKSTLSKLLIGLLEKDSGSIKIDGEELTLDNLNEVRKKIGIVFQNPDNQFVGADVRHDIAFGLENRCIPRDEMIELIDKYSKKVGMYEYLDREPTHLSGGQKQRVAIAGILAVNSDVIILDEATSMLDPAGSKETIALIRELKEVYNKTIITITHDLSLAKLSDRIIVLKEGKIISDDIPTEVFKDEELLNSSSLDMPFNLKLLNEVKKDDVLKHNNRLVDELWKLSLMK